MLKIRSFASDKVKKMDIKEPNRFLISINVLGSTGPIKLVVKEDDVVHEVIKTALKSYATQARLPPLGSDATHFLLYCVNSGPDALSPSERIGVKHERNFLLCRRKKETTPSAADQKGRSNRWKTWLNKSLSFKNDIFYPTDTTP